VEKFLGLQAHKGAAANAVCMQYPNVQPFIALQQYGHASRVCTQSEPFGKRLVATKQRFGWSQK
jgi:hypothetical protein